MTAFRKFIHTDVKKMNIARREHIGRLKRVTSKETKSIIRVLEASPFLPLKAAEIGFLIKMEGPTGVELRKSGIIIPLMEGPTGSPVFRRNGKYTHIINRSYGKRGIKKTESRKVY